MSIWKSLKNHGITAVKNKDVGEENSLFFTIYLPSFQNHVKIIDLDNPMFKMMVKRGYFKLAYE